MENFNLGDSSAFGDGKDNGTGNHGAKFWGHDILKFDGSDSDKEILLKTVQKYIRVLTEKEIPVTYCQIGKDQSFTDGKQITISSIIIPDSLDSTLGLGLHEACHIVLTDFKVLHDLMDCKNLPAKYHNYTNLIKDLWNWVEDRRIDYWAFNKSVGFQKYYVELYNRYFYSDKVTKILKKRRKNIRETANNYLFYIINYLHPDVQMDELKGLPEIEKVIDYNNINRWKNSKDTLKTAVEIFDVMVKYLEKPKDSSGGAASCKNKSFVPKPKPIKEQKSSGGSGSGSKDNGENVDSDEKFEKEIEAALNGQRKFLDGKPVDENGSSAKGKMSEQEAKYFDALCSGSIDIEKVISVGKNSAGIQSFDVLVVNKVDLKTMKSGFYNIFVSKPNKKYDEYINRGFSLGNMLGRKLKVRNDERSLRTVKLKKGKIDKRNIHSAGFGSQNIFYTLKDNKASDINIHISVDSSSSMDGPKWNKTLTSIVAICKAAAMVKGIRVQLSFRYGGVFNSQGRPIAVNFYDSNFDKITKLRLLNHVRPYGGTPEGLCFEALRRKVMAQLMNSNTVFINFSDGEPFQAAIDATIEVIKKFRQAGLLILSYFITENANPEYENSTFVDMYGKDAEFIDVNSVIRLATTINKQILKMGTN